MLVCIYINMQSIYRVYVVCIHTNMQKIHRPYADCTCLYARCLVYQLLDRSVQTFTILNNSFLPCSNNPSTWQLSISFAQIQGSACSSQTTTILELQCSSHSNSFSTSDLATPTSKRRFPLSPKLLVLLLYFKSLILL